VAKYLFINLINGETMNKKEFLKCIAKKTDKPVSQIDAILTEIISCITNTISKGDRLAIPGLGIFSMKKRMARKGRNPQTGETIKIAARKVPKFSASKTLKDAVDK
jgi:DNA-binding protein HU-beta